MKRISYERLSGNTYVNSAPSSGVILSKQENGNRSCFQSGNSPLVSLYPRWQKALEFVQVLYHGSQQTGERDNRFIHREHYGNGSQGNSWHGDSPRRLAVLGMLQGPPGRLSPGLFPGSCSPPPWLAWQHCPLLGKHGHHTPPKLPWPRTLAGNTMGRREA